MDNETKYITSDLYLAAYLKVKGHKFLVEDDKKKSNFVFDTCNKIVDDINDYLSENGQCEPLSYTNAIKNIKNYLYNKK